MTKFLNNADIKGYIAQTAVTSYLLKADSAGRLVAAIVGTDYVAPSALNAYLLLSGGTLTGALSGTTASFSGQITAGTTLSLNGGTLAGNNIVSMRSNPTGGQFRIEKSDGSLSAYPFYVGVDGTALAYYYNASGALKVLLHTDNTSYFGNSLSVGYATYAATSYMLDVNGTARFTSSVNVQNFLSVSSASTLVAPSSGKSIEMVYRTDGSNDYAFIQTYDRTNSVFKQLRITGSTLILNEGGGNIGIGTTTTDFKVNISSASSTWNSAPAIAFLDTVVTSDARNWLIGNVATSYGNFVIASSTVQGGSPTTARLTIFRTGQLQLNAYTSSTSFSGTAAGYLAFDSSGNVITVAGVASAVTSGFSITSQGVANNTPSTPSVNAGVYAGVYAFLDLATQDANGGWIDFSKGDGTDFAGRIRYYHNPDRFGFHTAGGVEKITFDAGGNIVLLGGSSSAQSTLASGLTSIRFPNQYSSGYTDAGVKLYIFNSGTTIQGFTAGPAYDLQYHSSGSDTGRHAFYVANSEVIRFNKTLVLSAQNFAVGSQQGFDNPGGWNKNILIDGTNHGRFRIKASNYTYGNIDVALWADSSVSPSHGISGSNAVFAFNGSITSLTVGGNTVIHAANISSYTAGAVAWANITAGTRNNYNLVFQPNANDYAGLTFTGANGAGSGYLLIRGTSDSDIYTANGVTLVSDQSWLTLAQRTSTTGGIRFMTGATATTKMEISNGGTVSINGTLSAGQGIFGTTGGATDQGIQIRYQNYVSGYGRIRFYQSDSNHMTIHAFSDSWQGGGFGTGNSAGAINIAGGAGVTFGSWNSCDAYIATGGAGWFRTSVTAQNYFYASGSIRLGDMWNSTGGLYRPSGIMAFGTENEGWRFTMANDQKAYIGTDGNIWMKWSGEYISTTLGRKAVHRGEGENYVDYSRYVYNNGAYSGSGWIEPSDLGVRYASSAGSASSATYLPTAYVGGVQGNPQVYFNYSIGLKVAMTGAWSVWSDTMWINGYAGGDVPWMCALHFLRNSEPRFAISAQTRDSGGYGSYYEVITDYNIGSRKADGAKKLWAASHPNDYYIVNNWTGSYWQLTTNHGSPVQVGYSDNSGTAYNLSGFDKTNPSFGAVYASNWFRVQGDCGLYSQDYGGHLRRNTYSYGNWEIFGYAKNGYTGIVTINNYVTAQMHNSSGDFGFLTENGNWWNLFYNNGNNCWGIGTDNTYSGDGFRCVKYGSSQYGWTTWSDRRAKENISTIKGALDTVLNMRGVYFNYITDEAKNKRVGFIAQELELVLPEAVRYAEEIDEYNVEYAQIVSVLAEAMKEQQNIIVNQNSKIERLELLVNQLIKR